MCFLPYVLDNDIIFRLSLTMVFGWWLWLWHRQPNVLHLSCFESKIFHFRANKCFSFVAEKPWRSGVVRYGKWGRGGFTCFYQFNNANLLLIFLQLMLYRVDSNSTCVNPDSETKSQMKCSFYYGCQLFPNSFS